MFLNKTNIVFCLVISFWFLKQFLGSLNEQFRIPKELQIRFHQTHVLVVHPCTSRDPLSKDMLHCVHQGVAPLAIASLITHHFEDLDGSLTIAGLDAALTSQAWPHYQQWKNDRREVVAPTSSKFSSKKFGRSTWVEYPELASCYKGAMVKYMIFWASAFLTEALQTNDTPRARKRAYCSYCVGLFSILTRNSGAFPSTGCCRWHVLLGSYFFTLLPRFGSGSSFAAPKPKNVQSGAKIPQSFAYVFELTDHSKKTRDMIIFFTWMKILWNIYLGLQAEPTPIQWTRWYCTDTVLWLSSACDQKKWSPAESSQASGQGDMKHVGEIKLDLLYGSFCIGVFFPGGKTSKRNVTSTIVFSSRLGSLKNDVWCYTWKKCTGGFFLLHGFILRRCPKTLMGFPPLGIC